MLSMATSSSCFIDSSLLKKVLFVFFFEIPQTSPIKHLSQPTHSKDSRAKLEYRGTKTGLDPSNRVKLRQISMPNTWEDQSSRWDRRAEQGEEG